MNISSWFYSTVGSIFTTTLPVALPVRRRSYAFCTSSNSYTESTIGFIDPIINLVLAKSSKMDTQTIYHPRRAFAILEVLEESFSQRTIYKEI